MRIGFDAKWYFDGPVSGRIVVTHLLNALAAHPQGHEIVAITDERFADRDLAQTSRGLERKHMWGGNNLVANALLLARAAEEARCDVIVAQNFAPLFSSVPTIAFIYDILFKDYPQFYTWRERTYLSPLSLLSRRATRICTISESERDRITRAHLAPESRIDVVPMGVDSRFVAREEHDPQYLASLRSRFALPPEFLLYVGRLNARKNVTGLLRALPLLRNEHIPLVVAGSPDWKSEDPHGVAHTLGLADRVQFIGAPQDAELPGLFALAKMFVFPSWAEGFGMPPLEAMRSGVPCAVAQTTSLPEVCGDAAVYFDPASPVSIAAAIDAVLENAQLYHRLVIDGKARAAAFSWNRAATLLMSSVDMAVRGALR